MSSGDFERPWYFRFFPLLVSAGIGFLAFGMVGAAYVLTGKEKIEHASDLVALAGVYALGAICLALPYWQWSKLRALRQRRILYPSQPWLWRKDWAEGRFDCDSIGQMIQSGISSFVGLLLCATGLYSCLKIGNLPLSRAAAALAISLIVLILSPMAIATLLLFLDCIFRTLRFLRFGGSSFVMKPLKGAIGERLLGWVHLNLRPHPENIIDLRLKCVQRSKEVILAGRTVLVVHHDENMQDFELRGRLSQVRPSEFKRYRIPINIPIPAGCPQTSAFFDDEGIFWTLEVQVERPGLDYITQFTIPLFNSFEATGVPAGDGPSDEEALNDWIRKIDHSDLGGRRKG